MENETKENTIPSPYRTLLAGVCDKDMKQEHILPNKCCHPSSSYTLFEPVSGSIIFSYFEWEHQLQIWWDTVGPPRQDEICLPFLTKVYILKYCPVIDPLRLHFPDVSQCQSWTLLAVVFLSCNQPQTRGTNSFLFCCIVDDNCSPPWFILFSFWRKTNSNKF